MIKIRGDTISIRKLGVFLEENKDNGKLLFKTKKQTKMEQKEKDLERLNKIEEQIGQIKDKMETIPILPEIYLENTSGNHYKFYRVKLFLENAKYTLETSWGRIGNNPQFQFKEFEDYEQAKDSMYAVVLKKINNRGYHIVK